MKEKLMAQDKLRFDLIHPVMLEDLAYVFTIGAKKHGANNWLQKPIPHSEQVAALYRHLIAYLKGEVRASDDGQLHLGAIAWRAGTLAVYDRLGIGVNDLPINIEQAKLAIRKELG